MKILVLFLSMVLLSFSWQTNPMLDDVRQYYNLGNGLQCSTSIQIEVPGMTIPEKNVFIEMKPNQKPKIKGAGLVFLPKKGLSNQFNELLSEDVHVIEMGQNGDTSQLKLVAINPKSDWVTADLFVLKSKNRIEKMIVQSRDNGEYMIEHTYGEDRFPSTSVITFQTEKFNLPLQLINRAKESETKDGPVTGKIILTYSNYKFL